jgi:hypothetical protein
MKIFEAWALFGVLTIALPAAAQVGGTNNNAGGASPSDIPGSMGNGTAENSPTEKPGSRPGKARSEPRAAAMRTPAPGAASRAGMDDRGPAVGK